MHSTSGASVAATRRGEGRSSSETSGLSATTTTLASSLMPAGRRRRGIRTADQRGRIGRVGDDEVDVTGGLGAVEFVEVVVVGGPDRQPGQPAEPGASRYQSPRCGRGCPG